MTLSKPLMVRAKGLGTCRNLCLQALDRGAAAKLVVRSVQNGDVFVGSRPADLAVPVGLEATGLNPATAGRTIEPDGEVFAGPDRFRQ